MGETCLTCHCDRARVHKNEHICKEKMALRHIQHNYCHQQGQYNGAQCLTYSQTESV